MHCGVLFAGGRAPQWQFGTGATDVSPAGSSQLQHLRAGECRGQGGAGAACPPLPRLLLGWLWQPTAVQAVCILYFLLLLRLLPLFPLGLGGVA